MPSTPVRGIFPTYRKEMKGLDWGRLYTKYGERKYNPVKLDKEVAELMADKEVQRHGGIYEFLLSDRTLFEKLNLRAFDPDDMRVAYEKQNGFCPICKVNWKLIIAVLVLNAVIFGLLYSPIVTI